MIHVQPSQEEIKGPRIETKGELLLFSLLFPEAISASRGLCWPLHRRWNNWLAYLLLSSDCWQLASPGDLAYRQQVKQTGNYSVTFSLGCCSGADSAVSVSLFSRFLFLLCLLDLYLHAPQFSLLLGLCRIIIVRTHLPVFVHGVENNMWESWKWNDTNALWVSEAVYCLKCCEMLSEWASFIRLSFLSVLSV